MVRGSGVGAVSMRLSVLSSGVGKHRLCLVGFMLVVVGVVPPPGNNSHCFSSVLGVNIKNHFSTLFTQLETSKFFSMVLHELGPANP